MSEPGGALPPTHAVSSSDAAAGSSSDIPLWLVAGLVLLMIVGAGLVGYVLLNKPDDHARGPAYPHAWDPRIAPYAKQAEKLRGLTFLHPVEVRFLPDDAFTKTVQVDESAVDEGDRREMERGVGLLRAFGLLSGDVDLLSAANQMTGSGVLAYYSFEDKRVTIRGTELTPAARPTLVHELTHALQDQHFGVGERLEVLRKKNEKSSTTEYDVLDAIVEGDAERVQHAYLAGLTAKERKQVAKDSKAQDDRAGGAYAALPQVMVTMFTAPYTLGEALVQAVAQEGGNGAIDDLLRDSPRYDAALLDPFRVLLGDQDPSTVATPSVDPGDKEFDSGEFGSVFWYLTLAQRMPPTDALTTVDGWNGDSYVAYEHAGVTCARAAYQGRRPADTARMLGALRTWIAAGSAATASVRRDGDDLLFQSCDPGPEAPKNKEVSDEAVGLAVSRTNLGIVVLRAGAPEQYARCISDKLVHTYSITQLSDPQFGRDDPAVLAEISRMAAACR